MRCGEYCTVMGLVRTSCFRGGLPSNMYCIVLVIRGVWLGGFSIFASLLFPGMFLGLGQFLVLSASPPQPASLSAFARYSSQTGARVRAVSRCSTAGLHYTTPIAGSMPKLPWHVTCFTAICVPSCFLHKLARKLLAYTMAR